MATKQFDKAHDCFPSDFIFEFSDSGIDYLVSQSVIPCKKYFGSARPFAFTEQDVAMRASVIKTPVDDLENKNLKPKQGVFFDGRLFDAYVCVADLIKFAQ